VLTFALDGKAALPAVNDKVQEFPPPPTATQDPVQVAAGAKLYARYCGSCHGDAAHSGGIIPDLRYTKALADDDMWRAVVLQGALVAHGMIGFEPSIGAGRLAEIRSYLISRAQQGYAEPAPATTGR
jgi:quinohemoprotein ethanol dehydrogenase